MSALFWSRCHRPCFRCASRGHASNPRVLAQVKRLKASPWGGGCGMVWAEVDSLESLQSTGALVGEDGVSWMWGRATWGQPTSLPPAQASPRGWGWGGTVTGQKPELSSSSENIISKKGHTPWWHRVTLGSVYHGKLEALPQRSKKEHRFLLLINFMVDLTVLK